ncbi:signal peptidase I [Vallitaleaceae bacterium 9-2]
MKKIMAEVLEYVKIIIIALLITNFLNVFVFSLSEVRQSSMETTLMENDQLVVERLSYSFGEPKRGDIIVFIDELEVKNTIPARIKRLYEDMLSKIRQKDGHLRLVKRVIGLPGDEINIEDGYVFVNGQRLEEEYLSVPTNAKSLDYPLLVEEDHYFVLGDNRTVSLDSRDFGSVPIEKIEGRVMFRFWPLNKMGLLK